MLTALDDLWYGNIAPYETCGVGNHEIEKLHILMERHKTRLLNGLDEQNRSSFEKYAECSSEYCSLLSLSAFKEGFSLAVKFLMEVPKLT